MTSHSFYFSDNSVNYTFVCKCIILTLQSAPNFKVENFRGRFKISLYVTLNSFPSKIFLPLSFPLSLLFSCHEFP